MRVEFVQLSTVSPERLARWQNWLAADKRSRIARLPGDKRLQSLCGDGLAREMLGELLQIAPEKIEFTMTKKGKPLVDGAFFSISHSGDLVGCAVDLRPVGLDIEQIRPVPPHLGRALQAEWQTPKEFWRAWAVREAAVKCRGDGLGTWRSVQISDGRCLFPEVTEGYAAAVFQEQIG